MVNKLAPEQVLLQVSIFPHQSSFHHSSILVYHHPLRCMMTLTRQHIITSSVLKFGGFISDLELGWLQRKEVMFYTLMWCERQNIRHKTSPLLIPTSSSCFHKRGLEVLPLCLVWAKIDYLILVQPSLGCITTISGIKEISLQRCIFSI
jgi:hypothetical protein